MKIMYMGSPKFSAYVLEGLLEKYSVDYIITNPDKEKGRKRILTKTPVKEVGERHNIKVLTPNKIKEVIPFVKEVNPDLIITCAYGKILPKDILDIPKLGCINVHASLLPKLRGGAPIQRSIMDGYKKTGITIMYMAEGMDDGDIISQKEVDINEDDTYGILHDKLMRVGKDLLLESLPSIINKTNKRVKQNEEDVTYAPIIKKEDERIDLNNDIVKVYNQIRGLNPTPGAYIMVGGKRLKIFSSRIENLNSSESVRRFKDGFGIKFNDKYLVLTEVQLEGKTKESGKAFMNGHDLIKDNLELK